MRGSGSRSRAAAADRGDRPFSQSGLWAITLPKAYGGASVSNVTLAEVVAIIAAADGSLGQIPQNHFYMVEALRLSGSEEQKQRYFQRVLDGDRLGNAFTEVGTRSPVEFETKLLKQGDRLVLNGQKFYSTGALFAHLILVVAADSENRSHVVFLDRSTPGLTLIDDWSSFGQRTTGSGSTWLDDITVEPEQSSLIRICSTGRLRWDRSHSSFMPPSIRELRAAHSPTPSPLPASSPGPGSKRPTRLVSTIHI
jgi:alkylation response protein AidB-like acyl-CoA dehydrogenase